MQMKAHVVVRESTRQTGTQETLFGQFRHFDWKVKSVVDVDEFCVALERCGFTFTDKEVEAICTKFKIESAFHGHRQSISYMKFLTWTNPPTLKGAEVQQDLFRKAEQTAAGKSLGELLATWQDAFASRADESCPNGHISRQLFRAVALDDLKLPLNAEELRAVMEDYADETKAFVNFSAFLESTDARGGQVRKPSQDSRDGGRRPQSRDGGAAKSAGGENRSLDKVLQDLRDLVQNAYDQGVEYHVSFEHFDGNYSGMIDEHEFQEGMERLGYPLSDVESRELFDKFGAAETGGKIHYRQFLRTVLGDSHHNTRLDSVANKLRTEIVRLAGAGGKGGTFDLAKVFKGFDTDGDGNISLMEFRNGINSLGMSLSDSEVRALMEFFDKTGDGTISYGEFIDFAKILPEKITAGVGGRPSEKQGAHAQKPPLPKRVADGLRRALSSCVLDGIDYRGMFEIEDTENTGFVGPAGVERVFKNLQVHLPEDDIHALFASFGNNGQLDYVEMLNVTNPRTGFVYDKLDPEVWREEEKLRHLVRKRAGQWMSSRSLMKPWSHFDKGGKDRRQKGYISQKELVEGLKKFKMFDNIPERDFFKALDLNGDGRFSFSEFCVFIKDAGHWELAKKTLEMMARADVSWKKTRSVLKDFDHDRSGFIPSRDFPKVLETIGISLSASEVERLINRFDTHGNGKLNCKDIVDFVELAENSDVRRREDDDFRSRDTTRDRMRAFIDQEFKNAREFVSLFERIDTDYSSVISQNDFAGILARNSFPVKDSEVQKVAGNFAVGRRGVNYRGFIQDYVPRLYRNYERDIERDLVREIDRVTRTSRGDFNLKRIFREVDRRDTNSVTIQVLLTVLIFTKRSLLLY
jgi:Ca2+-binding EF-hand superfamily protein